MNHKRVGECLIFFVQSYGDNSADHAHVLAEGFPSRAEPDSRRMSAETSGAAQPGDKEETKQKPEQSSTGERWQRGSKMARGTCGESD